ncbi:hypothetical protein OG523_05930 [Streptomyces virginiae]|nr:hypothetical protein [Streptomyces virginiae]
MAAAAGTCVPDTLAAMSVLTHIAAVADAETEGRRRGAAES